MIESCVTKWLLYKLTIASQEPPSSRESYDVARNARKNL